MNWVLGILNASQASYLPLQNNAILTNRRFEIVGATQNEIPEASASGIFVLEHGFRGLRRTKAAEIRRLPSANS